MEKKSEAGSEAHTENGANKENKTTSMKHGTEGADGMKMEMHHHVHHHHHEASHHEHHHGGAESGEAKKMGGSMASRMYDKGKNKGTREPMPANEGE